MATNLGLPDGFVLDNSSADTGLPEGFQLDALPEGFQLDEPTQKPRDLNSEFHPLRELTRGGAGLRSMIQGRGFTEGATNPEQVPTLTHKMPYVQTGMPWLNELQHIRRGIDGTILDMAVDPLNAIPLPVGKLLGKGVTAMSQADNPIVSKIGMTLSEFAAKHMPNLTPNVTREYNKLDYLANGSNAIEQGAYKNWIDNPPGAIPEDPQHLAYKQWLEQNQGLPQEASPVPGTQNIPGKPPMQLWDTEAGPSPDAPPWAYRDPEAPFDNVQAEYPGIGKPPVARSNLQEHPYEQPLGPVRDQGQQEFDFTQGPPEELSASPTDEPTPTGGGGLAFVNDTPQGRREPDFFVNGDDSPPDPVRAVTDESGYDQNSFDLTNIGQDQSPGLSRPSEWHPRYVRELAESTYPEDAIEISDLLMAHERGETRIPANLIPILRERQAFLDNQRHSMANEFDTWYEEMRKLGSSENYSSSRFIAPPNYNANLMRTAGMKDPGVQVSGGSATDHVVSYHGPDGTPIIVVHVEKRPGAQWGQITNMASNPDASSLLKGKAAKALMDKLIEMDATMTSSIRLTSPEGTRVMTRVNNKRLEKRGDLFGNPLPKKEPVPPVGQVEEPVKMPESPDQQQFDFTKGPELDIPNDLFDPNAVHSPRPPEYDAEILPQESPRQQVFPFLRPDLSQSAPLYAGDLDKPLSRNATMRQRMREEGVDLSKPVKGKEAVGGVERERQLQSDALESLGNAGTDPQYYENFSPKVAKLVNDLSDEYIDAVDKGNKVAAGKIKALLDSVMDDTGNILNGLDEQSVIQKLKEPSLIQDIWDALTGFEPEGGLHSAFGLPPMKRSAKSVTAAERLRNYHGPRLAAFIKSTGGDVSAYVRSLNLPPDEAKTLVHYLTRARVSNFNVNNLSPEQAEAARKIESQSAEIRKKASDTPLGYDERIARAGTTEAKDTANAISSGNDRNAAAGMDRISMAMAGDLDKYMGDPSSENWQIAHAAMNNFRKAGTVVARMLEARKHVIANLETYRENARTLFEAGDITEAELNAFEQGLIEIGKLPKPASQKFWGMLHEFGVNNLLSVLSNIRNISGNTMMAPLAPLTKATQGVFNATVGRPVNKAVASLFPNTSFKPFKGTEVYTREAGAMAKEYAASFTKGMKLGVKYFNHETDAGVYKEIQRQIAKLQANTTMDTTKKAKKLADLQKQAQFVKKTLTGGTESFREQGGLTHRRQIPGQVGKQLNTMTRGLSAMDMAFRYPMTQAAEAAIRKRVAIRDNIPLSSVQWTPDMLQEAAHEAAYYTFNQELGGVAKKIQSAAQPTSAGGYAAANVLVFMKNAINIGKVALDHGALTTSVPLLDPMIGPLLNRWKNPGKYGLDTKALSKSLAGLGLTYLTYSMYKKAGWEFHLPSDIKDTKESEQRRVSGVPTGVFAVDKAGKTHDLSQAQPATMFFTKMALWDHMQRMKDKGAEDTKVLEKMIASQAVAFFDSSMLTGSKDLYTTWDKVLRYYSQEDKAEDDMNPFMRYLSKNAASRLIPALTDEINRTWIDKTARDPNTAVEFAKQRVPFLSQQVPAKVDWSGKDVQRLPSRAPFVEMTVGSGDMKNISPANKELLRLGVYPEPVSKRVEGMPFTSSERRSIRRDLGPIEEMAIETFISTPEYQQVPEFMKASMLKEFLALQNVGEKKVLAEQAMSDPEAYAEKYLKNMTKGRSLTDDNNKSFIYTK